MISLRWLSAAATILSVGVTSSPVVPGEAQDPHFLPAQQGCRIDSSAAWFVKQREWLDDSKHTWTDDTLRSNLLRAAGLSPAARPAVQLGWEIEPGSMMRPGPDSSAIASLLKLAATRGATWPVKSVAGANGTRAVWMLAHRDTTLLRAALHRMMEAGPDESNSADVATLEDRLRLQSGRKQIYGTQFRRDATGALSLAPMEDSTHVDLRREDAGLPPFAVSACLARAVRDRQAGGE